MPTVQWCFTWNFLCRTNAVRHCICNSYKKLAFLSPGNESCSVLCLCNLYWSFLEALTQHFWLKEAQIRCFAIRDSKATPLIKAERPKKSLILVTCHIDWKCTINTPALSWLLKLFKANLCLWVFSSTRLNWEWEDAWWRLEGECDSRNAVILFNVISAQ